ncbi:PiggyBac transposable element-derived protein 4 [Eumeta japonica]|uniref:PiggyBac transposable element-derived protein 4 n=1 Tax=Eumeta variegata TaxID=151549 RepID=A0A4C2A0T1_EUMVA|nr:PiggyBac transposable element-derived protein 4 [Eumeta japonica]
MTPYNFPIWQMFVLVELLLKKAAGVGIKTYELCESETGYLWRFEVHTQNLPTDDRVEAELSGGVATMVLRLLQGLEYRGHSVWMDNFYNSPTLARILKAKAFPDPRQHLRLHHRRRGHRLTSSYHGNNFFGNGDHTTSSLLHDYNLHMGGLGRKNRMLADYPMEEE